MSESGWGTSRKRDRRTRRRRGLIAGLCAAVLLLAGAVTSLEAQQVGRKASVAPFRLGIELSEAQRSQLRDVAVSFRGRRGEPGASWTLAAEVRKILTPEQVAELAKRQEEMRERVQERLGKRREALGQRMEREHAAMADALGLDEQQRSRLAALREDAAGFEERMERRAAHRAAMENILTDEQKEIVVVHNAITARRMRGRMARRAARHGRRMHRN